MIRGPLEADGRMAAKNAVKIRAALNEVADFKKLYEQYQQTHPISTDKPAQDRARARAWVIMNARLNEEPLQAALWRTWAEAYALGDDAAGEWIQRAIEAKKTVQAYIDWDKWKPGDKASAVILRKPKAYSRLLERTGVIMNEMKRTTFQDIGTSLADAVELGLDAVKASRMIAKHVASPSRALTIAITEQNRAMTAATIQRYKQAEISKVEWEVSDPCPKCAMNANQVREIGQPFDSGAIQPPAHPHCRCVLLPVIPGAEDDTGVGGSIGEGPTLGVPTPELIQETPATPGIYRQIKTKDEQIEFGNYQLKDEKFMNLAFKSGGKKTEAFQALSEYKSYGYGRINEYLRTGNISPIEASQTKDYIKLIDKVMKAAPGLPEPVTTYRLVGQGKMSTQIDELFADLSPGDIWMDKGYSSTSLDKEFVKDFKVGWVVEIQNPQGTKGVMLDGLKGKDGYANIEREWLLPRNTDFEVISNDPVNKTMTVRVKQ